MSVDLGGPRIDAQGMPDAAVDSTTPPVQLGQGSDVCGQQHAELSAVNSARGIAVDAAGILYFTREGGAQSWIGRVAASSGAQPSLVPLPNNAQPRILRVDGARGMIFVTAAGTGQLFGASTVNPAAGLVSGTSNLPGAHGLAIADDGAIFVSLDTGYVIRLFIDLGMNSRAMTTATPIFPAGQRPLGLAFGPDGRLYVGSSNGGIKRFRVQAGMLVEGAEHGQFVGSASDLAFDVQGRLYVADSSGTTKRAVSVVPPSGTGAVQTTGATGILAGLAFGRGSLDCASLYVSDVSGIARRYTVTAAGLRIP